MWKKTTRTLLAVGLTLGLLLSNGPFYVVSSLLESLAHSRNIVDTAWHLSHDPNVVDNFDSLRHVADKIRIQEAHAAITYQSASSVVNSSIVPITPTHNASIAAGDLLVLIIGQKPSTACSGSIGAAPEGWTAISGGSLTGAGGYGCVAPGADTGDMNIFSYYKIAEGNETGTLPVRIVTNNAAWAQMYRFTNATEDWTLAATTGSDTSAGSVSIAMSADPGVASGDHILAAMAIPTDVSTPSQFSVEALSQSGITFGTVTEVSEPDSTTGNDIGGFVVRSSVSSGTSGGVPTLTATAGGTTTNVRGPGVFIRIRATGTITYQSANTLVYAGTTSATAVCPAHPSSVAADDLLVTIIGQKPSTANSGSVTTPSGWTAITNGSLTGAGGYSTTLGADTGNTNVFSFYRTALGTEASERCFALATNGVSWAQMFRLSNDSDVWNIAATTGSDTSGDSSVSIAMSADPGVTTGDHILGAMVIPTDVTTPSQFSAESFTQTGVTFGTVTEVNEPDTTTTGNDLGGVTVRSSVSSGTGSAAPTMIATAAGTVTNVRGPGIFIRVRETSPTFEQAAYRLFSNANSTDVGSALAAQDTSATLSAAGDAFRLRMLLHVATANLAASAQNFKLQFAQKSGTCDTAFSGENYADVTTGTVIAYNNNATPADGDNLTANANDPTHSGHTIVNQDYEEANNFTNTVAAVPSGQDGKWDFSLIDNGASSNTGYCLRVVESDGSTLDTYSVIPEITTAAGASLTFSVTSNDFPNITPGIPVFATTTLSVDSSNGNGWNVTLSGDDQGTSNTVMDLTTDAAIGITDQLEWIPGAATTSVGNAVRIASLDNSGDVLAFRVMTASGTVPFRASTWWGSTDSYADAATTLWAGIASSTATNLKIGQTNVSSGGAALSTVLYYLDVPAGQQAGSYSGGLTYTATVNP